MSESISSIGGVSRVAASEPIRSREAARLFQKVDANQNGKITAAEFTQAAEAEARRNPNQGNLALPSPAELFQQLDQGNKGYLTQQDLEAGIAAARESRRAQTTTAPGSPPRPTPANTRTSVDLSSSSTPPNPEDLNDDGTVTLQEKIRYVLNQYAPIPEPPKQADQTSLFG